MKEDAAEKADGHAVDAGTEVAATGALATDWMAGWKASV